MVITNKTLYAILSEILTELEVLREEVESVNKKIEKPIIKDLDTKKKASTAKKKK